MAGADVTHGHHLQCGSESVILYKTDFYSLGNFVSDQRDTWQGQVVELTFFSEKPVILWIYPVFWSSKIKIPELGEKSVADRTAIVE